MMLFYKVSGVPLLAGLVATTVDGWRGGDVRSEIALMLIGAIIVLSVIEAAAGGHFGAIEIVKSSALVIIGYFFGKKEKEMEK